MIRVCEAGLASPATINKGENEYAGKIPLT
jgi:hypothetical protein